jgi:hypothetical protein
MCSRLNSFVFVISALYLNKIDEDMDEIASFYEYSRLFFNATACNFIKW